MIALGRFVLVLALAVLGCRSLTEPDRLRVLGTIAGYEDDDPRVEVDQSRGEVSVRVFTYGGGCHSKGETEVRVSGLEALVVPYDYTAPPGTVCRRIPRTFEHAATFRFPASGDARVLVRGLKAPYGDTITAERTISMP